MAPSAFRIRKRILKHFYKLGYILEDGQLSYPTNFDKENIRKIYSAKRQERKNAELKFIRSKANNLVEFFANGSEIIPEKIDPLIQEVHSDTKEADLFRLASLLWSIPVSRGFGRRIRFLVWDRSNKKLIGLFALGDPVFNLKVRDEWIGWNAEDRIKRLCNVMDAYVLGAVPPYSKLIGGKLIAALVASKEVNRVFRRKYSKQKGVISKKAKNPKLILVTTTSALGKSSIYNRLKINGHLLYNSLGFTEGWGHFHIPESLFQDMKRFLESEEHCYAKGYTYGNGPNWRFRVVKVALKRLELNENLLNHGIKREVFAVPLSSNVKKYLRGEATNVQWQVQSAREISDYCLQRWIVPRSLRDQSYQSITREMILDKLINNGK